jgi:hypothetical protein
MFDNWLRNRLKQPTSPAKRGRPRLEPLEDRTVMTLTVFIPTLTSTEGAGGKLAGSSITLTDSDTTVTASNVSATIDYGDGTGASSVALTAAGSGVFFFSPVHTYLEESGTSPDQTFTVTVVAKDTKNAITTTQTATIPVSDQTLSPGNPIPTQTTAEFKGVGTGTGAGTASAALASFETAIGGANNGNTAQPLTGGFRDINWDGVALDGTDFGGGANTTVISKGSTVGIPLNRFQTRGVYFGAVYAVSNDGFATVNPNAAGLFPAFTPKNTFVMFNDNGIDFKFVVPSATGTDVVSAASRGFGAIFLNVETATSASIEYFNGNTSLGKFFAPVGTQGQPEFLGELFSSPIVTNVQITCGTDVLFSFDGTHFTSTAKNDPMNGHSLVATDDFVYAEPVPIANGFPIVSGAHSTFNAQVAITAVPQTAFTGVVATFSDADPNANANDYTATINWGDGSLTNGTIAANSKGGFDVSGTHTYKFPGAFPVNVDVMDFGGSSVAVNNTALVGTANQRLVQQLYIDLLQRRADESGLVFWSSQLDAGATAQSVALGIEQSPEYRGIEVQYLYTHYLKRTADAAGMSFFTGQLAAGMTLQQVTVEIASSPEYFNNRGGGTANGTLAAFFQDALGRPIDANAQSFFGNQLSNNVPFSQVATEILNTSEAAGHLVDLFFQDFLRRHADPGGISFFTGVLSAPSSVDPVLNVLAGILGSPEYNGKVQANPLLLPNVPTDPLASSIP